MRAIFTESLAHKTLFNTVVYGSNETHIIMHTCNLKTDAGFRLTCRLPHCRFDDDFSSTAQVSLAAEG